GEGVESLGEGVPPRLKELDEKLSSIVTDYQAMLEVYQTFFQNFLQLEKNISSMSSEVNQSGVSVSNVGDMESMLANHEMSKQTAREMFKYVHAESIGVANKIKELEPEPGAEKDISILNRILNSQRKQLDHLYTNQEFDLESKKHSIQFDADLKSIQQNIDELSQKLNDVQDKSSVAAQSAGAALEFRYLETTIQLLAERIETFVTGADTLKSLEADTSHMETELHKLKFKWNEFQNQVQHTRDLLENTTDKGAEFCKQNRQFLSSVTMKSHLVSSPQDARDLLKEIDQYLNTREQIPNNGDSMLQSELKKLTEHFASLIQELQELANQNETNGPHHLEAANENEASDPTYSTQHSATPPTQPKVHQIPIRRELDTPVHIEEIESIQCPTSPTPLDNGPVQPRAPVFVEPLRNSVVEEGAKFTFKCKVSGFPTPDISWHKDGLSIENNPDYQTSFLNDVCSLTIDETFAEDSAKFSCVAKNSAGVAETYAFLSITECEPEDQITPPKFSLKLENVKFNLSTPASASGPDVVRLVSHVTGQPAPTVVWFKDGVELVEEEGKYRSSSRGGEAVLEIFSPCRDTEGRYECRATNRLGTESSSALVELDSDYPTPHVLVPLPQEAMVRAGQKLKLQCEVENLAHDTKIEWLYNGIQVGDHSRDIKTFIEDSKLTLLVSEAFPKDAGIYSLNITTPTTSIDSTCKVSVKGLLPNETSDTEVPPEDVEPVKPSIPTPLRDVSLFEGGQALLDCVIVGTPEPEVIWYHDGRPVKESEDFQLLFKGDKCSLLIKEVFVEDGGEYRVVAVNSAGEAESKCKLTVQAIGQLNEPVATRQSKVLPLASVAPPSGEEEYCLPKFSTLITDVLVREGEDAILEAAVEGNPAPRVKWTLNNKDIVYDDRVKSEFNEVDGKIILYIGKATQQDKGLYTLRAENSLGEVKCFSHVIVKSVNSVDAASNGEPQVHLSDIFEVPEFTETFSDVIVPEETSVKFECIAVGKPTPKIKWLFNNEPISGKDFLISTSGARQVLSIPITSMTLNGGRVSCVAENEAGRTSCSAQLLVIRSLTDSLIPILTPTMSVTQLEPSSGGGKYEMKRSAMFSSQSSFSSRANGDSAPPGGITAPSGGITTPFSGIPAPSSGIPAPFSGITVPPGAKTEVTQYSSEKRESTQQIGSQPVSHSESETIKEYKNVNGVESRNEKSTESSSSNFSELISKHEVLSSGGSHGSIPALAKSSSSSSITKTGQRKTVAPRFISPLNGKIVDLGADVVLEAIIEGYPTPEVKWSKNGAPLVSFPGKVIISFEHNKARLELKNATTEDGGRYTVTLENVTGSAGSTADLIVKKSIFPPVMCRRLLPQSIYSGDRLVMEVEIAGTPTPTIQWFKDNFPIPSQSQEYRLRQQGNSYAVIVEKATLSNSGTYKVIATNEGGEAISSADVRVTDKTVISALPGVPSVIPFTQELQPSLLQTDNKRDFSNSSNFFKQHQQTIQEREQQQKNVSSYQTQENLSVSKTLIKEDKNVNLKVTNDTMPLNMPYSIQSSTTETSHKETIIPVQTDNKTYLENQQTETTTRVIDSDQTAEGIEHTSIPKKCALDFFKNIIQENETEQKFLKETEKPLPPSFQSDSKRKPGATSPAFPHSDDHIPTEFSRNILSEKVETKSQTWKPVSPVPYDDTPLYLEPGPPPEICYTTDAPPQPTETFAERIKKMEEKKETTTTAEPVRPPYKPFESKPVVEERCTRTIVDSSGHTEQTFGRRVTSPPTQPDHLGPVLRPQADIHVRPTSPRPSAEGVSMEKLWTTKIHKESEITRPASPLARPPSPKSNVISEIRESSQTEVKRCVSPKPSTEGVRMDKMWAHASSQQTTSHPTSLMPNIPVPTKQDDEDEEAKRLAWSRKYLQEEETSTRTVKTVSQPSAPVYNPPSTPAPVYKPPTPAPAPVYKPPTPAPAPVYKPPTPAPAPAYKPPTPSPVYNPPPTPAPVYHPPTLAPVYHPPTPAPVYNPPAVKPPTPQFTPKQSYVAAAPPPYKAPVHHVSPPREQTKLQSSFDQSSSYNQSSYQTTQKTTPPWVKSETSQNVVTPPWVKPSPPSTPSHSSVSQNFSLEDRFSSTSQQRQVPIQYNGYTQTFPPKPAGNQYYKVESQENESRQYKTPTFSPQSSVVQESFSSQTVKEYQSSGSTQQLPGTFSESSVVEEHHLKPSVAKKMWPLVQNSSSSYTPTVPNFTSEPVVESSYSYERSNTDNGFVEKEVKTQKSFQKTEKQFAYPPPCRSSLKSKIAAFEEKNYHSDYDSKFDSSDSEIRRTGSLKRSSRPSSAASYSTLPKTYGRSSSACNFNKVYETTQRQFSQTEEVIPGLKPGSPPQILHASQFKRKGYNTGDSGYMADTEDFQSKVSQDGSGFVSSSNKKSMLIPQPSSPRHKTLEQTNRTEQSYSKSTRKHGGPPSTAQNPSRFVKGEFRESDYESDYEGKIKPKWRPYDSDTEDNVTYRPVRPNLSAPKRRSFHATATQPVPCPLEFDRPPITVMTQHTAQVKRNDFACPPPPKLDYHSVQTNSNTFEPKVFEDTQSMSQSESGENFHRSMNVQQSTRIMTSGGLVDTDSLLDAERRRLQRVEDMKRRFEEKSVVEAKTSSGGELFSTPHIPSIGTTMFSSSSCAQQLSHQSFVTSSSSSSSEQFFNTAHQQLTNGGSNFIPDNFGSPRKEKVITLTDSCFNSDPTPPRRLPIFITPLRDIAVVSGGAARFECIVQADPAPSITWAKDNQVIHPSHQHHIEFRNGVCRLTLPHAYPFDAGVYSCTAVNAVGTVETSANLTVPGEKRSFNL
ncbi:hypothetical protein WDU94_000636, partial [Cyamophila willieti]